MILILQRRLHQLQSPYKRESQFAGQHPLHAKRKDCQEPLPNKKLYQKAVFDGSKKLDFEKRNLRSDQ